ARPGRAGDRRRLPRVLPRPARRRAARRAGRRGRRRRRDRRGRAGRARPRRRRDPRGQRGRAHRGLATAARRGRGRMTAERAWIVVALCAVTTAAISGFGPAAVGGRPLGERTTRVLTLLPAALLAAL